MRADRPTRWLRRVAAALALGGLALAPAGAAAADDVGSPTGDLVLVGVGGLHWTDIDRSTTPTLWRLVSTGSVGSVSVRTGGAQTCPVDAWLTLAAVRRTSAAPPAAVDLECHPLPELAPTPGPTVLDWAELVPPAEDGATGTAPPAEPEPAPAGVPGTLGERLAEAGACTTAVGPGAAVALARVDGAVDRYLPSATALTDAELAACPVTVVDLGDLGEDPEQRRRGLARVDRLLGDLVDRVPAGGRVVVAGITGGTGLQGLPVAIEWHQGGGPVSWLTSTSTRRAGLVTLPDLAATAVTAVGGAAGDLDGAPVTSGDARRMSTERTVENRRYLTELTTTVTHLLPVLAAVLALAALLAGLGVLAARRGRLGPAGRTATRAVLLIGTSAPAGAFLAAVSRWWVTPAPVVAASLWTVAATTGVALAALLLARRWPPGPWRAGGAVAAVTWTVLTVDGLTGTLLQQGSILGANATVGARFYGFGNVAFAVYAASALVWASALAAMLGGRRRGLVAVGAVGLITVVVDGWPGFGADVGGILALVPAFAVLLLRLAGRGVTTRRALAVAGAAVGLTAVLAVLDWAAGPVSHLGLFVARVLDGRATDLLAGKAAGAWATVAHPAGAAAALAVLAAVALLAGPTRWRPAAVSRAYQRWPLLQHTVGSVAVVAVLGSVLNDSGVAVAVVVIGLVTGLLALSWADQTWTDAGARPADRGAAGLVRSRPAAAVAVGLGLAGLLLLGAALTPARSAGDVTTGGPPVVAAGTPVVVVGTAGVRWQDVDRAATPTLWALVRDGAAVGGIAPGVTGTDRRCGAAGWLALSAGRPVAAGEPTDVDFVCRPWSVTADPGAAGGAVVTGWAGLIEVQQRSAFDPTLGVLGQTLAEAGVCRTAVGPGAALALADGAGAVHRYRTLDQALADPAEVFGCPVTVVDAGAAPHAPTSLAGSPTDLAAPVPTTDGPERDAALAALDATVRSVLAAVPAEATVLLVDVGNPGAGRPWLGFGAVRPTDTVAYLSTASTRWEGVARLLDLPTTVLAAQGLADPVELAGSTLTVAGARPTDVTTVVDQLADLTTRDHTLRGLSGWLTGTPLVLALVLLAGAWLVGPRIGRRRRAALGRVLDAALLVLAALPAGLFAMTTWTWWRGADPATTMWLALVGATATVAGVAALAPRRPAWAAPALIAGLTFALLTLDALLGTPLHRGSPLGPSPTLGGRYYGFGNPTYSIYVVAALVTAAALGWWLRSRGHRVWAVVVAGGIGVVALLVDVLPALGADVGGGLVLLPAAAMVALAVGGIRVTWWRTALLGLAGVVLVAAIGVADWLRPAGERTHLGRFVEGVLDGSAWGTVVRKAGYAAATVTTGPVAWLTLGLVAAAVVLLWPGSRLRPAWFARVEAGWPVVRPLLVGLLLAAVAGSVVNDYGTRIATVLLAMAVPLVGLLAVRTPADDGPAERTGPPRQPTGN